MNDYRKKGDGLLKIFAMQPQRAIVALSVAVCLVLTGLVAFDLQRERDTAIDAAKEKTRALTHLLEEQARQSIRRVDLALGQAAVGLKVRELQSSQARENVRQSLITQLPKDLLVGSMAVIDSKGNVLVSTPVDSATELPNVADRDYFVMQREQPSQELRVGALTRSRVTGNWIVPVSIALLGPKGEFEGVLMGTLDPTYFQRFYDSIETGTNGFVTLFTREGWIIARSPSVEKLLEKNWSTAPMFAEHLKKETIKTVQQVVAADGIERVYSYRALPDYPVVVSLGVSMTDGLSTWRQRLATETTLLIFILLLILAATLVILRQLAERTKAEMALKLSEFSVQAASLATFWIAKDARILRVNDAACALHGYTREQLLSMSITDMDPDFPAERWPLHWQELRQAKHMIFETRHLAADGSIVPMEVEINYIEYEGEEYNFSFMRDITERLQTEADIKRGETMLRDAIDAVDEAFVLFDPQDRMVYCNDKYRHLYPGMEDLMVPGTHFDALVRRGASLGLYREALGNEEEWIKTRIQAHRDGHTVRVQKNGDGQVLRVIDRKTSDGYTVGFRVDITEQVRAAEAAQEASRYKSQFLANMSHEIRTPMNAILGLLHLLQSTPLDTRQKDYTNKTEVAAKSLLGLLNDILDFSKVEAGKMVLDPHPFRLDRMLRDISVVLSSTVGGKPVEVLFDIDESLPPVLMGDALRLQQVLINLGSNAVKFTAAGQVLLRVRHHTPQTGDDLSGAVISFAMHDTGIGIALEDQARIFSGFSQAEASTTRRFGGTGLGLAICKRLVEMMGGDLRLTSEPGEGSTFTFTLCLPVVTDPPAALQSKPRPAVQPRQVLVVDDNPVACALMERVVQSWGWTCVSVDGGEAALQAINARMTGGDFPFDVVYLDWQMPGMDGWETARRIRAMSATCVNAPVLVMVTANSRDTLALRTVQEQALLNAFLFKPMTASMMFDATIGYQRQDARLQNSGQSSMRLLEGMRILVVEDNLINQQVAEELLNKQGAQIALAANGELGVEAVSNASPQFDVVLMDIQMPVLDGYGATRRIRNALGLKHLPIVAMTANALASDRVACLAAGMNEHVGKPFELDHLVSVLLAVTGRQVAAEGVHPAATTLAAPLTTNAWLDVSAALARIGGMQSLYVRMAREFTQELGMVLQRYRALAQSGDSEALTLLLHSLKGTAATLGAMALSQEAAALEKLSRGQGEPFSPLAHTQQLELRVNATRSALEEAVAVLEAQHAGLAKAAPEPVASAADAAPTAQVRAVLQELMGLLEANDLTALECFAAARATLAVLPAAQIDTLDSALSSLDLAQAHALCAELAGHNAAH